MLNPFAGSGPFLEGEGAEAILAACDGRSGHVPYPATLEGAEAQAAAMAGLAFPRAEAAAAVRAWLEARAAPAESLAAAARLAAPDSLVVATGQQPCAAGGPLLVLYKALTALSLARRLEERLGRPVVPLFWLASEDHDLAEMAAAQAPGRGGEPHLLEPDLSAWAGRPAEAVPPDPRWQEPARAWLADLPSLGEQARPLAPRPDEGWSDWVARILLVHLGPLGLAMVEPRAVRPLAGPLFGRAIRGWREAAEWLAASAAERATPGAPPAFPPQEGPLLFLLDGNVRRRLQVVGGRVGPRGGTEVWSLEDLAARAEAEPQAFSAHGALRPVLQDSLLPVVAQVLGPGELRYQHELYRLHASVMGAGRRMPLLWPRLSAILLDGRASATMDRFGLVPADLVRPEELLRPSLLGSGVVSGRLRALAAEAVAGIRALRPDAARLEGTLGRLYDRAASQLQGSLESLAGKTALAEARVRGFAPEKLRRLSQWVRPGGRPQERVLAFLPFLLWRGPEICHRLLAELDPADFRPRWIGLEEAGDGD